MSIIEEKIEELCPNGIPFYEMGELGSFFGGITGKSKKDFVDGNSTFITYKNVYANPSLCLEVEDKVFIAPDENQRTLEYGDIIFTGSSETPDECGISSVITQKPTEKLYLNSFCFVFRLNDKETLLPEFSKFLFRSGQLRYQIGKTASGVTRYNVSKKLMEKIKIPVPPIEIQALIVDLLNEIDQDANELVSVLSSEIELYNDQREYYISRLFETASNAEVRMLEDLCTNCDSKRKPVTSANRESGEIPYYGASGIVDYVKDYIFDGDYLLVSEDGANLVARSTPIAFSISGKNWVNNHAHVLQFSEDATKKYVEYYLNSIDLTPYITGAAQPKLNQKNLNRIEIPVPVIDEQRRIVDLLENMDKLYNDLIHTLEDEVESRKQQYEYYRDSLLTFA
jgi:type I restriction enzyme S subunit